MSNYPEWWNTTITVYNKYEDPATRRITWYKTVLHNCFWKYTGNKITVGETTIDTDSTLCRIPVHSAFLEKYQWDNATDKSAHFTFSGGDMIVKGEVADEINEYQSGQRASDFLSKHKNMTECMVIEKCAVNTGIGRGMEHYLVKGV